VVSNASLLPPSTTQARLSARRQRLRAQRSKGSFAPWHQASTHHRLRVSHFNEASLATWTSDCRCKTVSTRQPESDLVLAIAQSVAMQCSHLLARPSYYSQITSPLGREQHLRAAGQGRFPAWKVGKLILARSEEVHAFIESTEHKYRHRSREPLQQCPPDTPADVARRTLAKAGLGVANDSGTMEQTRAVRKRR